MSKNYSFKEGNDHSFSDNPQNSLDIPGIKEISEDESSMFPEISLDEEFFNDHNEYVRSCVEETLGEIANESQKEELVNSILFILQKRLNKSSIQTIDDRTILDSNFSSSVPVINLFLISQPTMNPNNQQYPYYYANYQPQTQIIQQPQPFSTPSNFNNYYYYNPQFPVPVALSQPIDTESESKKHKSKKDKKKKDKKHKKSNDQKSKQKVHRNSKDKWSIQKFEYKEGHEFEGIFRHLIVLHGENISRNGTISVTSNSVCGTIYEPSNLLDGSNKDYSAVHSEGKTAWILFDFKNMEVEVTGYSIKTSHHTIGHITSWVIETSEDKNQWKVIDEHSDYSGLSTPRITKTFSVKPNGFVRYCRFRHTGNPTRGGNLEFNRIEFYGRLKTLKSEDK